MKTFLGACWALLIAATLLAACGRGKPPPAHDAWRTGALDLPGAPPQDLKPCLNVQGAQVLEWGPNADPPSRPEDTLILLAAGHGPNGNRPPHGTCYEENGNLVPMPAVLGKNTLEEDELTMALTLRLQATLERLGFPVELIRYGEYGTEGECAQKALFRKSPLLANPKSDEIFCDSRYLTVRGRSDQYRLGSVTKLCDGDANCVDDVLIPKAQRAISRAGQLVRDHSARLGIDYDPAGDNLVISPKVAYISIHFNSATVTGDSVGTMLAMFSGTVRTGKDTTGPNPALMFDAKNNPLATVPKNYVTSVFEHLFRSLRQSGTLPEATNKRVLVYQNVDTVNPHPAQPAKEFSFPGDQREGPLGQVNPPIKFYVNRPKTGATGPVTVASGLGSNKENYAPSDSIISIPNNITLEIAHYRDCRNADSLLRSLTRPITIPGFDPHTSPLDPKDPLDVAAEDIAHGLVEYYESYSPGFKVKACTNIASSGWTVAWCGNGGGGGGPAPDIDGVMLDPASVELAVGDSTTATLTFSNAGDASLDYSVSSDLSQVTVSSSASGSVGPGATASVGLTYACKPDEPGTFEGAVTISSNDPDEADVSIGVFVKCLAPRIEVKQLPLPFLTAFNFVDDPNADGQYENPSGTFDFYSVGDAPLRFTLEIPDWLNMPTTGIIPPGGRYSDLFDSPKALCESSEEIEGSIIIHSNDPASQRLKVPVRLLCPEISLFINPDYYPDDGRCTALRAELHVNGADHLQELYYSGNAGGEPQYNTPKIAYKIHTMYPLSETRNFTPVAPDRPNEEWDWSTYPRIPISSWVSTCSMLARLEPRPHMITELQLVHPKAAISYIRELTPVFGDEALLRYSLKPIATNPGPYTFEVAGSNMYGVVMNGRTKKIKVHFYKLAGSPEQTVILEPMSFEYVKQWLITYNYEVHEWDSKHNTWHRIFTANGGARRVLLNSERNRCRFYSINSVLDPNGSPVMPIESGGNTFWSLYISTSGAGYFTIPGMDCYPSPAPWLKDEVHTYHPPRIRNPPIGP